MDFQIISTVISLFGSLIGTFAGIFATSKLTEYRIKKLEEKVEQHNNLIERMYRVEDKLVLHEERIKVVNHRLEDLEGKT